MNISIFGKIIAGIGIAIILLSVSTVLSSRMEIGRYYNTDASLRKVIDRSRSHTIKCIYSRVGETRGFSGGCPIGGYSALVTYFGLFVLLIGGGLVLASRKPDDSTS